MITSKYVFLMGTGISWQRFHSGKSNLLHSCDQVQCILWAGVTRWVLAPLTLLPGHSSFLGPSWEWVISKCQKAPQTSQNIDRESSLPSKPWTVHTEMKTFAWSVQKHLEFPILAKIKWLFQYILLTQNTHFLTSFSFHSGEKVCNADTFGD